MRPVGPTCSQVRLPAQSPASATSWPHTLLWLSDLSPDGMLSQLDKMQAYHVNGFLYDDSYNHLHDDFLNGGAGRLSASAYCYRLSQAQDIVATADQKGITDVFMRLLADVYVPWRPRQMRYKFDVFAPRQLAQFQRSIINEATFARLAGMRGIWFDMEPYDYSDYWRQDQDRSMLAYGRPQPEVEAQYFKAGELLENAAISAFPGIQILLSPGGGYSSSGPESLYEYYGYFYAGMVQAAQAASANGFVVATEAGSGLSDLNTFHGIYDYEQGVSSIGGNYSLFHDALMEYDATHGTDLLPWQLTHDTVALPSWPYRDGANSPVARTTLRYPLDTFRQVIQTERALSPQYIWIYSETDAWLQSKYTCDVQPGVTTTTDIPCPGLVLRDILPPVR